MEEEEAVAEGGEGVGTEVDMQTTKKMEVIHVAILASTLTMAEAVVVGVGVIVELGMEEAEVEVVAEDMAEGVEGWAVGQEVVATKHS